MVITQVSAADVVKISQQTLGLSLSSGTTLDDPLLAASARRAAGVLCPCAPVTLASAVFDTLRLLTQEPDVLKRRAAAAVENLIIFGDLLELNQVTVDDPAIKSTWIFAAPPSFVVRPSGTVFVLGVVADEASPLPDALSSRVTYENFTRMLTPRAEEDLPAILRNLGLRELSQDAWLKAPRSESATELRDQMLGRLRQQAGSGAIADIRILDAARDIRFYEQRWVIPQNESGEYVARRPQAYGARLWGFAQLEKGTVTRFLDFPMKGQRWRGCDVAWHLQMAIDQCHGTPQRFRKRSVSGRVCFDFFSPLPQWASRRMAVVGRPATAENNLFSYWIPEREAAAEEDFLVKNLWLASWDE